MDHLVDNILANPLYIVIAVVILAVLAFAVIKKVLKLIVVALLLLVVYLGYVYYSGGDVPGTVKTVIEKGKDAAKEVKSR